MLQGFSSMVLEKSNFSLLTGNILERGGYSNYETFAILVTNFIIRTSSLTGEDKHTISRCELLPHELPT